MTGLAGATTSARTRSEDQRQSQYQSLNSGGSVADAELRQIAIVHSIAARLDMFLLENRKERERGKMTPLPLHGQRLMNLIQDQDTLSKYIMQTYRLCLMQ